MEFANTRVHPDYIAAVLMIGMAVQEIYKNRYFVGDLFTDFSVDVLEMFVSSILAVAGAAILLLTKHGSVVKTLTVSSLVFAVILLDTALMDLSIGEYMEYDVKVFLKASVLLILSILIIANTLIYWTKASSSLTLMFYALVSIMVLEAIQKLVYYRNGYSVGEVFQEMAMDVFMYGLVLYILLLLISDSVKVNTMLYNVKMYSREIRRSAVPGGVRIDREEIGRIQDILENGIDGDEYLIRLNSYYPVDYSIALDRTDNGISLSFSSLNEESGVCIERFIADGIWTDTGDAGTCDVVRIYGDDGFFIQLIAGEPYSDTPETVTITGLIGSAVDKIKSLGSKEPAEEGSVPAGDEAPETGEPAVPDGDE